jgi:Lipocalin-like domain
MSPAPLRFAKFTREGDMLNRTIVTATALLATILVCVAALQTKAADISKSLIGTWRVTSYSRMIVETNEVARPFGENPVGYIQYSPGGHMIVFLSAGEMPKVSPPFSDADQAAIYSKVFGAYAGTYSVDGNKVTHHIVASWRPDWVGGDQIRFVELNGDKLTIKTAPLVSSLTGKQIVSTLTFERVE